MSSRNVAAGPAGRLSTMRADWGSLTGRERDVAVLVARGLTNRQIAEALFLTAGTVANHVHRILPKFGFVCRAQIAAWVASDRARRAYRPAGWVGPIEWAGSTFQAAL